MARKKAYEQLDEWGNPVLSDTEGTGAKSNASDAFDAYEKNDNWDEDVFPLQKKPDKAAQRKMKMIISIACVLVLCAGLGVLITSIYKGKDQPVPTVTITETPSPLPNTPETISETPAPDPMPRADEWYDEDLRYYYHQLTEHEKALFTVIYNGIMDFQISIDISDGRYRETELERVLYVLNHDCPEMFQMIGSSTRLLGSEIVAVEPIYRMSKEEYSNRSARIRDIISSLNRAVKSSEDDFVKEFAAYRYVIQHCVYYQAENEDKTAYADAVLFDGKAQCAGYAKGLSLLLRGIGIRCLELESESLDHGWNIVQINGEWYHCDATWDDDEAGGYQREFRPHQDTFLCYLNLPDRLAGLHKPDEEFGFTIPQCNSLKDNYVYRKGIYIPDSVTNKDEVLAQELEQAFRQGKKQVMVMVDDRAAFSNKLALLEEFRKLHGFFIRNKENDEEMCSFFLEIQ